MNRNTLLIALIVGIIFVVGCTQQGKDDTNSLDGEFKEIEECIMGVRIDYRSGITVQNEADVEFVFNDFISWAQEIIWSYIWETKRLWI